jgi:beta-lactamase regulating signal transducer with metallopeptidase domain
MDIFDLFSNRAWQHLIVALLHTIWQGAILALLLSVALRRLPAYRHDARYLLALAAQFGVLLAGLATWSILEYEPTRPPSVTSMTTPPGSPAVATRPAAPPPIAAGPPTTTLIEGRGPRWASILAAAWLTGVVMMLGRTAGSVWSASRLARGPRVGDPDVLAMVGRIREELRIGRRIRVVDADDGCGPAVLGVLWPTLLLPASAMTGLPADTLRAILIHELAHIRRYDYLANIAQMVVESVLFFNPAVWWLGRQARLEREACCDAIAVRLTGRPIDYSRSLAEWAGRGPGVAIAAAWAGDRRPGTLLERIRRVLRPGERPAARVSPSGLLILLLGGPILLGLLWRGTTAAVGLAAQILSPAERIERIEAAQAEYAPPIADLDGEGTLKGTIRTAGGESYTKPVWLYHKTDRPGRGGIMGTLEPFRSEFSVKVPAGTTWLSIAPDDYAPAVVGPFDVRPGRTIDGITIVLEAGAPARIAVADGQGAAVPGARVSAQLIFDGGGSVGGTADGWITDGSGVATIPHAVERPYHVGVTAPGYEPLESATLTPSFSRTRVVTVKKTRPARGVAVDPQGKPVAGAEIRVYREEGDDYGGVFEHQGLTGPRLATTDADGRFTLDTLKGRTSYILFVTSKAGGRGISPRVRAGQENIRVTVGPRWTIKGTIKPRTDEKGNGPMPATVGVTQRFGIAPDGANYLVRWAIPVDPQGHFSITDLLPCEIVLEASGRRVLVDPDRPEASVTIDLNRPVAETPTRRVVLRIATPDGTMPPSGTIDVHTRTLGELMPTPRRELSLEKGQAILDAPVPGKVSYQLGSMVGYWFMDGNAEVEPGEGEQVIEIPTMPAGAIVGQVLDADGKPAGTGVHIRCQTVDAASGPLGQISLTRGFPVDAAGRFFASPLPLGGSYAVTAGRGHNQQVAPTVRLDGSEPTKRVTIRMTRDAAAEGRVVGPDGRPLAGVPVKLEFVHAKASMSWGPPNRTDDGGRFRFEDLSSEPDHYRAIAEAKGYQPGEAALRPGGPPAEIRLERGHVLEGRVLDAKTGWPIPGVSVYAHRINWAAGERYAYEAQGKTDEQGRFRFSNLPEGSWTLNDRNGLQWETPHKTHAFGVDGPEPIEIRATLPSWSDLKPRAPAG